MIDLDATDRLLKQGYVPGRAEVRGMAQALREARELIEYMARLSVVTTGAKEDCADWLARWFGK